MPFTRQRMILVIDDEAIVREVFEEAFAGQPEFVVDTAATVEMGVQKIRAAAWDLVFLDVKLEGDRYGGMKVLEALRRLEIEQQAAGKPFLKTLTAIMSGSVCFNDITPRARELDAFILIDKPTHFTVEFVRRVVNRLGLPLLPSIE